MKHLTLALTCVALLGLTGCEQEGPAERFGENIDEAAEEVRDELEDACEEAKKRVGAKDKDC